MPRVILLVAAVVVFGLALVIQGSAPESLAQVATPEATSPVAISSEVLGRAVPVAIEDPELALGRVTIMPGAATNLRRHGAGPR